MPVRIGLRRAMAMLIAPVLALMAAVLLTSPVHAEGNCPPGYYPIGGGNSGFQGCAPMSGHSGSDDGSPGGGRVERWVAVS